MVNIKNAVAFGLLAATASAASVKHGKRHHHRRAAKEPCTTTAVPFPAGNSTIPAGSDGPSSTSSREVVTVSVIPVPVSPTGGADTTATTVADTSANTQPAVPTPTATSVAVAQPSVSTPIGSAPAGAECGVATTYVTVQQTVTVTAGQIPESSSTSTETLTSTSTSVVSVTETPASTSTSELSPPSTLATTEAASTVAASSPAPVESAPATSSSAVSSPSVGGTYTGKKMGTSWDPNQSRSFSSLGINIGASWCYDWGQTANGVPAGVEYIPTLHDVGQAPSFASKLDGSGASYVKHLNEPDMNVGGGGSATSPGEAAALHNQYIKPLMGKYNIGFPAVTSNNQGESGTGWLKPFINQVGCDGFKFFDFHFYGGEEAIEKQAEIFLDYVEQWKTFADSTCPGLPIWITEFSAGPDYGNPDKAGAFMAVAGPKLEADPRVARYAYFFRQNTQISQALGTISQALSAVGLSNLVG